MNHRSIGCLSGLCLVMAVLPAAHLRADVTSGLFSRYSFDVDARDNAGSNDGTLTNGAAIVTDPVRGGVVSLDGADDYVSLPMNNMAAGRSEITMTVWIKPSAWASSRMLYDEAGGDFGEYWQFSMTGAQWHTRDSSTGPMGSRDNDLAMPAVPVNEWHHLAFVYSVSAARKAIYYDGAPYGSTSVSVDQLTTDRAGVGLGYAGDTRYLHLSGMADELRFYSRALTAGEIAELASTATYALTVNSGSGDGSYAPGVVVSISADPAPSGLGFSQWTGDVAGVANTHSPATTITMPASDAVITATYSTAYTLTVNSGSGDGTYAAGAAAPVLADPAPSGYVFHQWTGDVTGVADVNSAATTVTIPASNVTITATYVTAPAYYLTVTSGSGSGAHLAGAVVPVVASPAPTGQTFYRWVGDTAGLASATSASTTYTMPTRAAALTASYRDTGAATYTAYQNLDEATSRIYRLDAQPFLDLIDQNGFFQSETIIFHDTETGKEVWSLTRETCTDLANIERRTAWSCNGQYISFIGNKAFWDYRNNSLWNSSWSGYTYIANSDGTKRRKLWAVGPSGLTTYDEKFNNWDMAVPNRLYDDAGNKLYRITLGPGNNDTDNTAAAVYTYANSNSRTIQEMHDWNYMLVEESGSSPNCYVFNLNVPQTDPHFCMSYPLAGEVHPGSFRFRRSDLIVTGGYESIPGSICLKVDTVNGVLIPWTLPSDPYGEVAWHIWWGAPDDRVCFDGTTSVGPNFGLWIQLPGHPPVYMGAVCDGHPTWCGHDPDWAFYSSGTNEGEQPHVDPRYDRRIIAAKADGSQVIVMFKPWDRLRGGTQGYDAIPRPNQSADATKCWFHSSMLNPSDSYTGSYIGVFRKPYAPTAVSYSGGQINFTPHALSYEARCFRVYRNGGSGWQFVQEAPKGQTSCPASGDGTYMVTSLEWSGLESDLSSPTVTVPGGTTGGAVSGWDTTPPAKPTNLQVVKEAAGRYRLTWQAPADGDLRYFNVYFSSIEDPRAIQSRLIVSPARSETEYLDWTAPLGGSAFYGVTAVDYQGNESQPAYVGEVYHLTVTSGSGSGDYEEGQVVAISADSPASGKVFSGWTGDTACVAAPAQASTDVTMPAADVEVTATYAVTVLPGDQNDDGFVGQGDLDLVLGQWGRGAPPHEPIIDPRADANHDNFVGQGDLDIVLSHWGEGTLPHGLIPDP